MRIHAHAATTALALSATAFGNGSWDFTLAPSSTASQTLTIGFPLAGTMIGNYDAPTNPTGTRTLPGLWGGSGNNAIPYTSTLRLSDTINSHPAGTFTLALASAGTCEVSGFSADLINGTPGTLATEMVISYSSFHTVAPSSIYPSIGAVTVPLASGAVTAATAVQSGPALGTSVLDGAGNSTVMVAIPVMVTVAGDAGGQQLPSDPTPAVMTLNGTLVVSGSAATMSGSTQSTEPVGPLAPPPPLVGQPMSLPTIPASANTANLLVSGTFSEGNGTSTLNLQLTANGVPSAIPGDITGDGRVDGLDLTALFSAWGATSGSADINGDGAVDGLDLTALFSHWST